MAVRQCISGPDIPEHVNPFPAGVKIGNMVFSAAIGGDDPDMPPGRHIQLEFIAVLA